MTGPHAAGADAFLGFIRDNPSLLPEAPEPVEYAGTALAIRRRALDEVHQCVRCPRPAVLAFIAYTGTTGGHRWLDLCAGCAHWLRCH